MIHTKIKLTRKQAEGYIIPLGKINLVSIVTDVGMIGCGAYDVSALNNFGYPAARIKPSKGSSIATLDDLLEGTVGDANEAASELGIKVGMRGRDALEML